MKVLVENSTWNNVGDGWYQFSLYYMLKRMYPQHKVMIGEGPIRRSFRIKRHCQLENALNLIDYQTADIHVLSGPMLPSIIDDYKVAIENFFKRNEKYCFISASGTGLSHEKVKEIGAFLKKYPPMFMATRDNETYSNFKDYVDNIYNGICTAFLVDLNIDIDTFKIDNPFFISSFYTEMEPTYRLKDISKSVTLENLDVVHHKTKYGLPFKYARHLNFLNFQQKNIAGVEIVRTIQNLNTRFNHINFAMPNSFISFNPLTYLSVAKSAEFTISDRVHACAISLGCNRPARFLFNTPRAGIFDRLGFDYKSNGGIMYPNMDILNKEKKLLQEYIYQFIQ